MHFLKSILQIIDTGEVLPYLDRLGRFLLDRLLLLFLLSSLFLLFLLLLLSLAGVYPFECGLLLFLLLDLLESRSPPLFLGLLGQPVRGLDVELDLAEAYHYGPDVLHYALVQVDPTLLHPLTELLHIHALLVRDLAVLVHEDFFDGRQVLAEVHAQAGASLAVAGEEALQSFQEGSEIEVGGFFVGFLLLVEATLFLHTGEGRTLLLGLGLLSECALFGGRQFVGGVLAPVGEVTVTLHVALGETKNLKGLQQEFLLGQSIAYQLEIVSWILVRVEVVRGLSDLKSSQNFIQKKLSTLTIKVLKVFLVLDLIFQSLSQGLLLCKQVLLELNTLRYDVALHCLFFETSEFLESLKLSLFPLFFEQSMTSLADGVHKLRLQ